MPRVAEQELLTLPEHPSSPLVFSGYVMYNFSFLCSVFFDHCLFVLFLLPILLSVLPRFMASDHTFGIYKLFWGLFLFLLPILLSVLPRFMASDHTFGIYKLFWGLWFAKISPEYENVVGWFVFLYLYEVRDSREEENERRLVLCILISSWAVRIDGVHSLINSKLSDYTNYTYPMRYCPSNKE